MQLYNLGEEESRSLRSSHTLRLRVNQFGIKGTGKYFELKVRLAKVRKKSYTPSKIKSLKKNLRGLNLSISKHYDFCNLCTFLHFF